jgi:hypothetical protein
LSQGTLAVISIRSVTLLCVWGEATQILRPPPVLTSRVLRLQAPTPTTSKEAGQISQASRNTGLPVLGREGPYQVEGFVRVLEGQEHVLKDRQGSSTDDGVQQLGEDLEETPWSGTLQTWAA